MLRRFVAAAFVGASAAFGSGGGASAATWLAPVALTPADVVVAPELATAGAGGAVAVWDREVGSACPDQPASPACVHVVEVRSRPGGSADWQAPVEIARPGVGSAPQVALDPAGDAVVLWSHDIGVDRVLQASLRRGATGSWSEPVDLSEPSPSIGAHAVALDASGDAFATWVDASGVNAAIRPASTGVWSAPARLSRPGVAAPKLAVDAAGDAIVAWSSGGVVQAAYEPVASGQWTTRDVGLGTSPAVAIEPSGVAVAAWASGGSVLVATGSASDWTVPRALGTGAEPAVALDDDGDGVVVWSDAGEIEASFRQPYGPWNLPETLGAGRQPEVALTDGGNAVAAWLDGGIRAALRPAASRAWLPAAALSGAGASDLGLAPDGAGAQALWRRGAQVEAAVLVGTGPVVARPSAAPSAGVVGDGIDFSVDVVPWTAPLAGDPTWTFGDGAAATGGFVTHAYTAPGTYEVAVTQLDAAGGRTTATTEVRIRAAPPVALSRPSIRGRLRVGATLTCARGRWVGTPPIRYRYAWLRSARAISGARRPAYRIRPHDRGRALVCRVTATNGAGSSASTSRAVRVA